MAVKVVASVAARRQAEGVGLNLDDTQYIGLTKREHFAGLAMQGLYVRLQGQVASSEVCAQIAVEMADALLKELDK